MRLYLGKNVWDAALERIERIFDEFETVAVSYSGGKDSTVILELAIEVARRRGRLPIKVLWLDQEIEWESTVDMAEYVMTRPEVDPMWMQIPFRLLNATSQNDPWLDVWGEGKKWMRDKHPISMKENVYNCDRFGALFTAISDKEFPGEVAFLAGVRAEESPSRLMGLTQTKTYKDITWGKTLNREKRHYTFYPIYDWGFRDVWKAIHDNGWKYNALYDAQYRYGIPLKSMRVSNLHHETAVEALFYLQEVEPETYRKAVERIGGLDTAGKLQLENYFVDELPFMFSSWIEYRDYLLEHLILDEKVKTGMRKYFARIDEIYLEGLGDREIGRICIDSILTNDVEYTKLINWENRGYVVKVRREKKGGKAWV